MQPYKSNTDELERVIACIQGKTKEERSILAGVIKAVHCNEHIITKAFEKVLNMPGIEAEEAYKVYYGNQGQRKISL